jgi:hypothetical protein
LVGIAYPLLRLGPALYAWGMRRRICQLYGELKFVDAQLDARDANAPVDDLLGEINRMEHHVNHMRIPLAFAQLLYTLRHHISRLAPGWKSASDLVARWPRASAFRPLGADQTRLHIACIIIMILVRLPSRRLPLAQRRPTRQFGKGRSK